MDQTVRADQLQPWDSIYGITGQGRVCSTTALSVRVEGDVVIVSTRLGDHWYRAGELLDVYREVPDVRVPAPKPYRKGFH